MTSNQSEHLSDALLQAGTWRFFQDLAKSLGGQDSPEYVASVKDWFSKVHPDAGFQTIDEARANRLAAMSNTALRRYGITMTASGEEIGWTPAGYDDQRSMWDLHDGPYGLIDHLAEQSPKRDDETDVDYNDRLTMSANDITGEIFDQIASGTLGGVAGGVHWKLESLEDYDSRI